jgi:hypothetical protein
MLLMAAFLFCSAYGADSSQVRINFAGGYRVYVDGNLVGFTKSELDGLSLTVSVSQHLFEIRKTGFKTIDFQLSVERRKAYEVDIEGRTPTITTHTIPKSDGDHPDSLLGISWEEYNLLIDKYQLPHNGVFYCPYIGGYTKKFFGIPIGGEDYAGYIVCDDLRDAHGDWDIFFALGRIFLFQCEAGEYTPEQVYRKFKERLSNEEFLEGHYMIENEMDGIDARIKRREMLSGRPGDYTYRIMFRIVTPEELRTGWLKSTLWIEFNNVGYLPSIGSLNAGKMEITDRGSPIDGNKPLKDVHFQFFPMLERK